MIAVAPTREALLAPLKFASAPSPRPRRLGFAPAAAVVGPRSTPPDRVRFLLGSESPPHTRNPCRVALTGVAAQKKARPRVCAWVSFFNVAFFFPVDICRGHVKTPPGAFSDSGSPTPRPQRQGQAAGSSVVEGPCGGWCAPSVVATLERV